MTHIASRGMEMVPCFFFFFFFFLGHPSNFKVTGDYSVVLKLTHYTPWLFSGLHLCGSFLNCLVGWTDNESFSLYCSQGWGQFNSGIGIGIEIGGIENGIGIKKIWNWNWNWKPELNFLQLLPQQLLVIRTLHDCPSQMNENLLISNSKLTSDSELIWWR